MFGEARHTHKLIEYDVRYIRSNYIKRNVLFDEVALSKLFGVDRTTIHDIIRGKTWMEVIV